MSQALRIVSPSGAAYHHTSGAWGREGTALWLPFGDGLNGPAYAVANYNGGLVVVGNFTEAGGVTVRGVAFWNGTTWSALGGGVGPSTFGVGYYVAVYGGNLYIGGQFTSVNGVSAANFVMWNGSTFSALGVGVGGQVDTLHVFDGKLWIGGQFFSAGGAAAVGMAAWNGSAYVSVDGGVVSGSLYATTDFATFGGDLYSSNGQGSGAINLFVWGGSGWSAVADTDTDGIYGLAVDATYLYIATHDDSAIGAVGIPCVGQYDGATWSAPSGGLGGTNKQANAVHVWDSTIVAGGNFTSPAANVARHSGSQFVGFGDGLNGAVYGFTTFNGYLVAVGDFDKSGALTRNHIAYWSVAETP